MATSPARRQKRLSEREKARRARQSTASKSPRGDADAAAAAGDAEAVAAAAAALNPEAAARLAAAAAPGGAGGGEAAPPPLTMDQLPPDAARALGPMLERARQGTGAGGLAGDDDKKRAKKFLTLEMELAELLTFPAGPALMAGDTFCGEHFATQGPLLAHQLTMYAESHPSTYNTLVWLARQGSLLVITTSIVGYILPPAIHHGLPAPAGMRAHYGMEPQEPPLAAVA